MTANLIEDILHASVIGRPEVSNEDEAGCGDICRNSLKGLKYDVEILAYRRR
jgi:hypothetical protein